MGNRDDQRFRQARLLVVDDDPFTLKVVRRVLDVLQFTAVKTAASGETALAMMQAEPFDLLITDVQMPGINGLELVRRLRAGLSAAPRDTRAIVLTSFSNTEVLGVAMALEVNGFLVKPMKPATVLEKIAQAIGERINIKPALAYQSIDTALSTLAKPSASGPRPAPESAAPSAAPVRASEARRPVALGHLRPGMRIERPVLTVDGALLLASGHALSEGNIHRLLELRSVLGEDGLWIVGDNGQAAVAANE